MTLVAQPAPQTKPRTVPSGTKITSVRVDASKGLTITKLSALTIEPKGTLAGGVVIEADPESLPVATQWMKSTAPRGLAIEYCDAEAKPLLKLRLDACVPTMLVPKPTGLTLLCAGVRQG